MYYSGYTEEQLVTGHQYIVEKILDPNFETTFVCKKYANKKFLKVAYYALLWVNDHYATEANMDDMVLEE